MATQEQIDAVIDEFGIGFPIRNENALAAALVESRERQRLLGREILTPAHAAVIAAAIAFDDSRLAYDRIMNGEHDGPYLHTIGNAQDAIRATVAALREQEGA